MSEFTVLSNKSCEFGTPEEKYAPECLSMSIRES